MEVDRDNIKSFDEAVAAMRGRLNLQLYSEEYIDEQLEKDEFINHLSDKELEDIPVDKVVDYIKSIIQGVADFLADKFYLKFNSSYTTFTDDLLEYIMYHGRYEDVKDTLQEKAEVYMREKDISEDIGRIPFLKDNIGDTTELSNTIDVDNRSAAFMDIDGYIYVSKCHGTHAELINEYLGDYGQKLKDAVNRPLKQDLKDLDIDENRIAFGHVIDKVFIIEDTNSLSVEEVKDDICKCYRYKKIYTYDVGENKITRLAKSI